MKTEDDARGFDCVEFKHRAQASILDRIRGLTPAQEIDYFSRSAEEGPFAEWLKRVRAHRTALEQERGRTTG
jgi:hypothetical protein